VNAQAAEHGADGKRIPSTLMDPMQRDRELLRDVLQWDVQSWKTALDFWAIALGNRSGLNCLEIGAGSGGLSLWLALRGHHVTCSDRTEVARTAAELHRKYGVAGTITYADVDATTIDFEECFDVVVFKSVLGGIGRAERMDRQELAVREMHKALKPGGQLLFAENGAASPLHQLMRKRFVPWGAEWRYPTRDEMRHLLAPFSRVDLRATGFLAAFGRSERQRDLLAFFDRWGFKRVVPESLSYIFYGSAVK
jgi:SAM-dependent methyltransferase